jgi:hypothetical protein
MSWLALTLLGVGAGWFFTRKKEEDGVIMADEEYITVDPHPELMASHANPPISPGLQRMPQSLGNRKDVQQWFISVLNNPSKYPMYSMVTRIFGDKILMIRVEWHTWTNRRINGVMQRVYGIYRGTTGYMIPLDGGVAPVAGEFDTGWG